MTPQAEITFEDGMYVFSYKDDQGFIVTDGQSIEELYTRIKEAMDLHYQTQSYTLNLTLPIRLSFTNSHHAVEL